MNRITLTLKQILIDFLLTLASGVIVGMMLRGCNPKPEPSHTTTIEKSAKARQDSTQVNIETKPIQLLVTGKPKLRASKAPNKRDSVVCMDSVGYFSLSDSLQLAPDTVSVCHNLVTNELSLLLNLSSRRENILVKYTARDSLVVIRDSVREMIFQQDEWWHDPVLVIGSATIGLVLGTLISVLLH